MNARYVFILRFFPHPQTWISHWLLNLYRPLISYAVAQSSSVHHSIAAYLQAFIYFFYGCHDIVHFVCFFFLSQVLWSLPFIYKVTYKSFLLIKRIAIKSGNYTSLIRTGMVEITIWFIHSIHSLHTFLLLAVCQAFLQKLKDAQ